MSDFAQRIVKTSLTAGAWSSLGLATILVLLASANFPRIRPTMVGEGLLGAGLAWNLFSMARRQRDGTAHPEDPYFMAILITTVTCGSFAWLISLLR